MTSIYPFLPRVLFRIVLVATLLVVVFGSMTTAYACPTCKDGLAANDAVSQAHARGYFYSILFMMAMPFVIVGTFGSAAYISIRRAREQQLQRQDSEEKKTIS